MKIAGKAAAYRADIGHGGKWLSFPLMIGMRKSLMLESTPESCLLPFRADQARMKGSTEELNLIAYN